MDMQAGTFIKTETDEVHAALKRKLAKRELALESLLGLIERMGTSMDLDTVVKLSLMTVSGQLSLFQSACYLSDSPGGKFVVSHSLGIGHDSLPGFIERSGGFVDSLRKYQSLVLLGKESQNSGNEELRSVEYLLADSGFSYAFPLIDGGEMLGILLLSCRIEHDGFDEFSTDILHMISKVASMAIRNAMLYRDLLDSKMEIEDFSRVKREFLNHTSHELRTPLTILKSSIWSMEARDGHDGMLVEMAKSAVERLNGMIEQVLAFNEIGLNDSCLELEQAYLTPLLESCLRERLMELGEMGITFKLDKLATPIPVVVDQVKMKIVFKNLVDNAISSVEPGGSIYLSTSHVAVEPDDSAGIELTGRVRSGEALKSRAPLERDEYSTGVPGMDWASMTGYLVIRIKDNGVGIPTEEIRKMSEPFRRASNSKTADVKGMGLGLSVSQKIIAAHGARLFCKSSRGAGAEFSIWVPLSQA